MGRARPRLTAKVRRGLGTCSAFLDVNWFDESDLLQNSTEAERDDTKRAMEWIEGMIAWYDARKGER